MAYRTEEQRVATGARLMDRILPGWHKKINLKKLDMGNGAQCLLGQTFGHHTEKSLAEEMYPEEYKAAKDKVTTHSGGRFVKTWGYPLACATNGGMLNDIMRKLGLDKNKQRMAELNALETVCAGHDNRCIWAEEIATRIAQDEAA